LAHHNCTGAGGLGMGALALIRGCHKSLRAHPALMKY
jgi:hypothetical protein